METLFLCRLRSFHPPTKHVACPWRHHGGGGGSSSSSSSGHQSSPQASAAQEQHTAQSSPWLHSLAPHILKNVHYVPQQAQTSRREETGKRGEGASTAPFPHTHTILYIPFFFLISTKRSVKGKGGDRQQHWVLFSHACSQHNPHGRGKGGVKTKTFNRRFSSSATRW